MQTLEEKHAFHCDKFMELSYEFIFQRERFEARQGNISYIADRITDLRAQMKHHSEEATRLFHLITKP